jgi:hypothetical protein
VLNLAMSRLSAVVNLVIWSFSHLVISAIGND